MPRGIYKRGIINRKPHTQKTKDKMSLVRRGIKLSDKTKEKIRKAKTGVKYPNRKKYFKGKTITKKICLFCGKEFVANYPSAKRVKFCSQSCSSKSHPSGRLGKKGGQHQKDMIRLKNSRENHPRWIKDRTKALENKRLRGIAEAKEWRMSVFFRDDFTCQDCGVKGKKLNAHHIKPWRDYPELRFDIDNGITLCEKCHLKTFRKEELFEDKYLLKIKHNVSL